METYQNGSKGAGCCPIQMHKARTKNKMAPNHLSATNPGDHEVNRASDGTRRHRWNWIGHIMRKATEALRYSIGVKEREGKEKEVKEGEGKARST